MVVRKLSYAHPGSGTPVLNDVDLAVQTGMLTTVLGPNGSGKTTLFKCIAGLWKPTSGEVLLKGESLRGLSHNQLARLMALVPQEHEPPFPYSVIDVVTMGRAAHLGVFSAPSKDDYRKAEAAISDVGISPLKDKPYTRISGGERQLVLIARALTQEAPVMLLDEPTSHLDFKNQVIVLNKVREIVRQKSVAAIMTIHDPNLANLFSDQVILLKSGRVVAAGTPAEIITEANLGEVYGMDVSVVPLNGVRFIIPRVPEG